ncbi:MAG: SH3 domain-containing protein [Lachnospiraceae bacterium]|nr:SH3 domain-containing protein [Lachnospiraceae bacterium]
MNKWFRENYRVFSVLFLLVLLIGWTIFLEKNESGAAKIKVLDNGSTDKTAPADKAAKDITGSDSSEKDKDKTSTDGSADNNEAGNTKAAEAPVTETPTTTNAPITAIATPTPVSVTPAPTDGASAPADPTPTPVPATPTPTPVSATPTPVPVTNVQFPYVLANVQEKLNVRSGPGENYDVIAKLRVNSYAKIVERGTSWTKIRSGDYIGYASSDYLLFDNDAISKLREIDSLYVKVTASQMNIRKGQGTDTEILGKAVQGDRFPYVPEKSTHDWICITYNGQDAYASAELVTEAFKLEKAVAP